MKRKIYVDYYHPLVKEKADALTKDAKTTEEKLINIFLYVRDSIKFRQLNTGYKCIYDDPGDHFK